MKYLLTQRIIMINLIIFINNLGSIIILEIKVFYYISLVIYSYYNYQYFYKVFHAY